MIGGTGNISLAVSQQLLREGHELHLYCRGNNNGPVLDGAVFAYGDIHNEGEVAAYLRDKFFDVVVNWIIFEPSEIQRDIRLFTGKTKQYIFISTTAVYQKPPTHYIITEKTPQGNPFWEYARKKMECEGILMEACEKQDFPATIVRPSLTYGTHWIPYCMGSKKSWSLIHRLRSGKKIIVPGDGTNLWTATKSDDFARGFTGLVNNPAAIGEDFHITSDEVLTWNLILAQIAEAAGVQANPAHISTDFITTFMPEKHGSLIGDKVNSLVFDNSKIKSFVPGFQAKIPFREGVAEIINMYDANPALQITDPDYESLIDRIIAAHDSGKCPRIGI